MPSSPSNKEALPTQQFIEIKGVKNGVLILKSGALRQVLMVSGINFDLKSEEEQEAITLGYQNFLNSLDFSIQIFIHSRKLNIDSYLTGLSQLEIGEVNPLLRNQIVEYREFIRSFVSENAIMNKTYFVVVPFDPVVLPAAGQAVTKRFFGLISKTITQPQIVGAEDHHLDQYIQQLNQRSDQVIAGLNQIGLRAVPLNDDEMIELYYNLYNPEGAEKKGLEITKGGAI